MKNAFKTRFKLIANNLRLVAVALENVDSAVKLREVILTIEAAFTLLKMSLFRWDKSLLDNAKYGFDATEMKDIL